jgi:hypothetical protein
MGGLPRREDALTSPMAGGAASADAGGPHPEEPNGLGKGPALRCLVLHEDPLGLVGGARPAQGPQCALNNSRHRRH